MFILRDNTLLTLNTLQTFKKPFDDPYRVYILRYDDSREHPFYVMFVK